jgi:hypothetical protein
MGLAAMAERSGEFRKAAVDCLRLAQITSDPSARASLLLMAQSWFNLATEPRSQTDFDAAVRVLNEGQMQPRRPVTQQQQQIQPEDDEK